APPGPTPSRMIPRNDVSDRSNRMYRHNRSIVSLALATLVALALIAARPAAADPGYTFAAINVPGAVDTELTGLSSQATVGEFEYADGITRGFILTGDGFWQLDVPGAWFTRL